jgi:NAD(P)-dependent dehydrogenase (short-subunit alcohol dehydrogenase family)
MNVFITGSSSGIGAALAQVYALDGATIGLIGRRSEELEKVRSALPPARQAPHFVAAVDVCDNEALNEAARAFVAHAGVPDIVIASAGISTGVSIEIPEDIETIARIVATNIIATAATFAPFITAMRTRQAPRLVAISSVAGVRGLPGSSAYSASKSAVTTMAEALRIELRDSRIRVVTIAPGFIATPMTQHNPYPMPFLMPVERFAMQAKKAIDAGVSYRVIPWQMGVLGMLMRLLPNMLWDRIMGKAQRKPRAN